MQIIIQSRHILLAEELRNIQIDDAEIDECFGRWQELVILKQTHATYVPS